MNHDADPLSLVVPTELVELIAARAAEIVRHGVRGKDPTDSPTPRGWEASPYLSVQEAAEHLRAERQRVYDLLSARKLTRYKDGRRVLVSRAELDAYLAGSHPRRVAPALPPPYASRMPKGLAE